MIRIHVVISGQVQGVFFRAYAKEQVDALGIAGWIRNNADGRVEAVFEGEKKAIDEMLKWCYKGSPNAHVEKVQIEEEPVENLSGFGIQ